jgi:two-component system nitrogen regulation response regulator NtrX
MTGENILVIDDEPGVRTALEGILEDEGFRVESAGSGEDGLRQLRERQFDAVLLDVWLPGIDGLETLAKIQDFRRDTQVIMISGHGNIDTAVRATKLGAFDFIEKPLSLEKTLLVLRNALRQRMLENRSRRLMRMLSRDTEVHGDSPAAVRLRARIEEASSADTPVLVIGGRGSGREAVARRIHAMSTRSEEAFVDIPCGALDSDGAAEAIFGKAGTASRLSMARRGSVLFEDLHLLDPELQQRLEAYLRSETFRELDARPLATVDPSGAPVADALREQIGLTLVEVPALRERREDVAALADHYMTVLVKEYGRRRKTFSDDCRRAMSSWDWPGNVRELRNLVETLLLQVQGPEIRTSDLPEAMGGTELAPVDLYGRFESLAAGVAAFEEYYIRRVVRENDGDLKKSAGSLGLKPDDLKSRLVSSS